MESRAASSPDEREPDRPGELLALAREISPPPKLWTKTNVSPIRRWGRGTLRLVSATLNCCQNLSRDSSERRLPCRE